MNDMSRSQSASRISEDIGDVLGAIRRLIADDESLDQSRNDTPRRADPSAPRGKSPRDDGQALAARFGGAAALARRMVQDSAALNAPQKNDGESRPPSARAWPHLVADRQMPAARPSMPGIVALRDQPARQASRRLVADLADDPAPLRLGEADRVGASVCDDLDEGCDRGLQGKAQTAFQSPVPAALADAEDLDDFDDFAEAFDAKARMRPDFAGADIAPVADRREAGQADMQADAVGPDTALCEPAAADPFWQAYAAQTAFQDDPAPQAEDDETPSPVLAGDVADDTQPLRSFGLTIPVYTDAMPSDEQADDCNSETLPDPVPQVIVEPLQDEVMAETSEVVDEASIREVIREIIQEELHGELGQRFSRNLRAVIRREVAASIDEHLERL